MGPCWYAKSARTSASGEFLWEYSGSQSSEGQLKSPPRYPMGEGMLSRVLSILMADPVESE